MEKEIKMVFTSEDSDIKPYMPACMHHTPAYYGIHFTNPLI